MTWKMLARDGARVCLIVPTLASVAMIVLAEAQQAPAIISRGKEAAMITTLTEETMSVQSAARFMQSLTKLYRPGRVGVLGRLLMQSLERLLKQSREKLVSVTRKLQLKRKGVIVRPGQKLLRWLRRRTVPDEG